MPNFNAVAHLVRPAERGHTDIHTDIQTDRYTSKDRRTPFHKSGRASRGKGARFARTKVLQLLP